MVAMIPLAVGTTMVYPSVKHLSPEVLSAEFLYDNKVSLATTVAAGTATAIAGVAFGVVGLPVLCAGVAGLAVGAFITDFITPGAKEHLPESVKDLPYVDAASDILLPPLVVATTVKFPILAGFEYYLSYKATETYVTPAILDTNSTSKPLQVLVTGGIALVPFGVAQIPIVAAGLSKVSGSYTVVSRGIVATAMSYTVADGITSNIDNTYIQENKELCNVVLTLGMLTGGYFVKSYASKIMVQDSKAIEAVSKATYDKAKIALNGIKDVNKAFEDDKFKAAVKSAIAKEGVGTRTLNDLSDTSGLDKIMKKAAKSAAELFVKKQKLTVDPEAIASKVDGMGASTLLASVRSNEFVNSFVESLHGVSFFSKLSEKAVRPLIWFNSNFLNIDEAALMSKINIQNERVLKKVELPKDPMVRTFVSDTSSTVKTGAGWFMGQKKGSVPYTALKTVGAAIKPGIKLSPVMASNNGLLSSSKVPYYRIYATYSADLPSTLIAEIEKFSLNENVALLEASQQGNVWNIALTSSCFKTVGQTKGADLSVIWKESVIVSRFRSLDGELNQYCASGDVSDFCLYLIMNALPKCVHKYIAYKIRESQSLKLTPGVEEAIEKAIEDVDYYDKNKEDRFCGFLGSEAINNHDDLDLGKMLKLKKEAIPEKFWYEQSPGVKADIQSNYAQFISISEFAGGTKSSLSLWDYWTLAVKSRFVETDEYLPSLSWRESAYLLKSDAFGLSQEIGVTYAFAVPVRGVVMGVEKYLNFFKAIGYPTVPKYILYAGGGAYLYSDIKGREAKEEAKEAVKVKKEARDKFLANAVPLLNAQWQDLYKSHQDGAFDRDKVAKMNPLDVTKSMHLCDDFKGFARGFNIETFNSTTATEAMKEIERECAHVREAYEKLEYKPQDTRTDALKFLDKIVSHTFDPSAEPMDSLLNATKACTEVKHFDGPEAMSHVCTKVEDAIVDLRNGLSSEHFEALPVGALGDVTDIDAANQ